jgi:putative addiction module component (TIGR02574 family)
MVREVPGSVPRQEGWRMNASVEHLLQEALKLPDEQQLQLVSALVSAVEQRRLRPFDDFWLHEIKRRSAEYDAGTIQAIPWAEVKECARRKVTGHEGRGR